MRHKHLLGLIGLLWLTTLAVSGADLYSAAQRQEAEEQARRVNARLATLEEALQAYQHEITVLKAELRGLREELARAQNRQDNTATQESIKQLAAAIQEVDRKRLADQERTLAEIRRLGRTVVPDRSPPSRERPTPSRPEYRPSDKDFEYEIKPGDTLSEIVRSLREQGFKTSLADIERANPKLKASQLQVGQKIIIPAPAP